MSVDPSGQVITRSTSTSSTCASSMEKSRLISSPSPISTFLISPSVGAVMIVVSVAASVSAMGTLRGLVRAPARPKRGSVRCRATASTICEASCLADRHRRSAGESIYVKCRATRHTRQGDPCTDRISSIRNEALPAGGRADLTSGHHRTRRNPDHEDRFAARPHRPGQEDRPRPLRRRPARALVLPGEDRGHPPALTRMPDQSAPDQSAASPISATKAAWRARSSSVRRAGRGPGRAGAR